VAAPATGTDDADSLAAAVTRQASMIKELKKGGGAAEAIQAEVAKLQELRRSLEACQGASSAPAQHALNRKAFDDTLIRRMFVVPSFEIHGGVAGLFDLGPPGCALKANIVDAWRKHFVLEEKMLEMECTCLTPENVLKTSGHVDRFTDLMVKDVLTGDCYRADKLLEDWIDELLEKSTGLSPSAADDHRRVQRQADAYAPLELDAIFKTYGISAPATGNALTPSFAFNLMFGTKIGPSGNVTGFLRPETAQGLFVNFKRLLDYNNQKVPFAAAQIGLGFRNEIAPKNGLLRVREFTMAEIEHFVHPTEKAHAKFADVAAVELSLFDNVAQMGSGKVGRLTAAAAVAGGIVANETLMYFMARTQLFMEAIGMDASKLRFRQHLKTEMAHYAADCWDLEILTHYGWVECVGHADRACYDLAVHAAATNTVHEAQKMLDAPIQVDSVEAAPVRKAIGLVFKKDQKAVGAALEALAGDEAALLAFESEVVAKGEALLSGFLISKDMVDFRRATKTVQVVKFTPSVIEPSFGIGRILHALLEHSFSQRDGDEQRVVMKFHPAVAPIKCGIYNLQTNAAFLPVVSRVEQLLTRASIASRSDTSGQSVGKRYARSDELGTPFGCTIDFTTLSDDTVTLRERDSMAQVRVSVDSLPALLRRLVGAEGAAPEKWADATAHLPSVDSGDAPAANAAAAAVKLERTSRCVFMRPTAL